MYRFFSKLLPKKWKEGYVQLVKYSSLTVNPDHFLGFIVMFGFLLAITIVVYSRFLIAGWSLSIFLISLVSFHTLVFLTIYLSADKKAKFVDTVLPDALQILASNLRAGLTLDKAIFLTSRPEFGPLQKELDRVSHEITLGKDLGEALKKMLEHVQSTKLQRVLLVITTGTKSGGSLAPLLEETAEDMRKEEILDQKIKASIGMYTIFIFFAVGFASPGLFGLSYILVQVISKILGNIEIPQGAAGTIPISIGDITISLDFIFWFILVFITSNCLFGSLILGAVSKGKAKRGIIFMPLLIFFSYTVYYSAILGLTLLFGDLFGI